MNKIMALSIDAVCLLFGFILIIAATVPEDRCFGFFLIGLAYGGLRERGVNIDEDGTDERRGMKEGL